MERDIVAAENVDFAKGESAMTDLQFTAYIELRDKYEALLQMKLEPPARTSEESVSDYQFKRFEQVRDRCEELNSEVAELREENSRLKIQVNMLRNNARKYKL